MGFTYKANSDDIRNPAVAEMYAIFTGAGLSVDIIDSHADVASVKGTFGIELSAVPSPLYDLIIVTIGHDEYLELDEDYFIGIAKRDAILADIKGIYRNRISKIGYWTL
ncbi:MAG: UDP binding domain-containing protein [Alistipes indistinctus]